LHARDKNRPFPPLQARSFDAGRSWIIEPSNGRVPGAESLSADEHLSPGLKAGNNLDRLAPTSVRSPVDFLDPETIVMDARTGLGGEALSWFYVSRNRGKRWDGPHAFAGLSINGLAARTDIVARSSNKALLLRQDTGLRQELSRDRCIRQGSRQLCDYASERAVVRRNDTFGHSPRPRC
jgi:hypothetical protein